MSDTKYTRGPWIYDNGMIETHKSPDGHVIASINNLGDKVETDANLICAAPEMYEALKSILQMVKMNKKYTALVEEILMKIEEVKENV